MLPPLDGAMSGTELVTSILFLLFLFCCIFCIMDIVKPHLIEDKLDQLNSVVTTSFLLSLAILTFINQMFKQPLKCFVPRSILGYGLKYYEDYCFINNDVFVHDNTIQKADNLRDSTSRTFVYYQFIPLLLLLQAILFLAPRLFWIMITNSRGDRIENIVSYARRVVAVDDPAEGVSLLVKFIEQNQKSSNYRFGRSSAAYYVIKKWLALLNVVAQFLFMAFMIPIKFDVGWAIRVMPSRYDDTNPYSDHDQIEQFFPFVVGCLVNASVWTYPNAPPSLQKIRIYAKFPCVITGNYYTEKCYIILYFWLLLLFILNLYSAIRYTAILYSRYFRRISASFMFPPTIQLCAHAPSVKQLGVKPHTFTSPYLIDYYLERVLKSDGILIFVFIHFHCGPIITHEFCQQLWNVFVQPPCDPKNVTVSKATDHLSVKWDSCRRRSLEKAVKPSENRDTYQKPELLRLNIVPASPCPTSLSSEFMDCFEECDETRFSDGNNNNSKR